MRAFFISMFFLAFFSLQSVGANTADTNGDSEICFNIYPNPADTYATLEWLGGDAKSDKIIQILDAQGKLVEEMILDRYSNLIEMDVSDIVEGIYFVRVIVEAQSCQTVKLQIVD